MLEHIITNSTVTPLPFFIRGTIQEKNQGVFWGREKDNKIQLLFLQPLFIFVMQSSAVLLYAIQLLEDRWQKYLIIHSLWKLTSLSAEVKTCENI